MTMGTGVTRRAVLAGGAAAAGVTALVGCGSTARRTGAGTAGGSSAGSPGAMTSPGTVLAELASIPVGQAAAASLPDGQPIVVARPTATTAAAFSAICTHMGCTVNPAGTQLHCPCHGSVYNATTGAVIHGPAPRALPAVPVRVAGGRVVTA